MVLRLGLGLRESRALESGRPVLQSITLVDVAGDVSPPQRTSLV